MSGVMFSYHLVDTKTSKTYNIKHGKQLLASSNYSGPEDVDVVLACADNVAPFLVELLVKKQSAHVTCIAGACVARSIGIGPGGTLKIRNGNTIEFGEVDGCIEIQFNIVVKEESDVNEVAQKKPRPKRKLPETPGLPVQPPPKPTRKTSDEIPPPKPQRTRAQTTAAVMTTPHQVEIAARKKKILQEVNSRKQQEQVSIKENISAKVANSICYQLMLQPNSRATFTIKLINSVNHAIKIMEEHMRSQMEKFLEMYQKHLIMDATPECLLPADIPVVTFLLDALIRCPSMQENTADVCSSVVEVLVMLSTQNCHTMIECAGLSALVTVMKMPSVQLHFGLHCNSWKLLTSMIDSVVNNTDKADNVSVGLLEMSVSLARQQLFNFDNNAPLACAIVAYLVKAVTFCSTSSNPDLGKYFTTLQEGDLLKPVMSVAINVKNNEHFKVQCSNLVVLLAPSPSSQDTSITARPGAVISERQDSKSNEDIPIAVDETFTKELDKLDSLTFTSLKTSVSTGNLEMGFRKLSLPHEKEKVNPAFSRSKSSSRVISTDPISVEQLNNSTVEQKKKSSRVAMAFFEGLKSKPTTTSHMDMDNPYMKHTLKRKSKKVANTADTPTNDTIVLRQNTSNDNETVESDDGKKAGRQSWGTEMADFSHLPGTIREFSKEQAFVEEIFSEHEEIMDTLTTRQDAISTLVPLWFKGKSLQSAVNTMETCFTDDDNDIALFSDLLSIFRTHQSGWTLAVSLIFLSRFQHILENLTELTHLKVTCDALKMILERFSEIILSCRHSKNNRKPSARHDSREKELCYVKLKEIHEMVAKKLSSTTVKSTDSKAEETMECYKNLYKMLAPFKGPL